MDDREQAARVTINLMRGCLVVTIQLDPDRLVFERMRKDLLRRIDLSRSRRVILDCSGVEVLDAEDFAALRRIISMASLMGARTVLAGMQPGVVSALIDLDADLDGFCTALSLDDAFDMLDRADESAAQQPAPDDDVDEGSTNAVPK